MIMSCLNPAHTHGTVDVPAAEALVQIEEMINEGVNVETRTFIGRTPAETVTIFWTRDAQGGIGTLWEHTFTVLTFNVPPADLDQESMILAGADSVNVARAAVQADGDAYAEEPYTLTGTHHVVVPVDDEYAVGE